MIVFFVLRGQNLIIVKWEERGGITVINKKNGFFSGGGRE
jgi:hypothetical protein